MYLGFSDYSLCRRGAHLKPRKIMEGFKIVFSKVNLWPCGMPGRSMSKISMHAGRCT